MVSRVNTGAPLQGGTVNAPGQEQQSQNTFFDSHSISGLSHIFSVDEQPYYIKCFGLTGFNTASLIMVTMTSVGELNEPMKVNGFPVAFDENHNFLVIDLPGQYRLLMSDSALGVATIVGGYTALSFWSWGLQSYGLTISGGNSGGTIGGDG